MRFTHHKRQFFAGRYSNRNPPLETAANTTEQRIVFPELWEQKVEIRGGCGDPEASECGFPEGTRRKKQAPPLYMYIKYVPMQINKPKKTKPTTAFACPCIIKF
jgi:hypothetical protein